jgi:hypothetical protein
LPMLFTTAGNHALSRFGMHERGNAPFPREPAPMLVEKAATLLDDPAWTYEPKWNGFRVLAMVREGSVRLISRNGHSFTNLFWPISDALRGFPTSILLDGEVIAINDKGQPDFETLVAALSNRRLCPRSTCPVAPGRAPIRHRRRGRARGIRVPRVRGGRRSSLRDLYRLGGGASNMENKSCVVALAGGLSGRSGWGVSVVARGQASSCLRHGVEFVRYHFETLLDLSLIEEHLQGDFKITCTFHPFRPNHLFERRETLGVNLIVHRAGTSHVSEG